MKSRLSVFFAIFSYLILCSQTRSQTIDKIAPFKPKENSSISDFKMYPQHLFCGSDAMTKKFLEDNPESSHFQNAYERRIELYSQSHEKNTVVLNSSVCIIPVVFHILHENGIENISKAQVCDAVALLNEDFRKMNADTVYTVSQFKSLAADSEIEFRLATKDPNGNPTSGINRIYTSLTHNANDSSKVNQWPPSQYLNIWVVDSLEVINGINGVQGYAYSPALAMAKPQYDGVLIRHDCVGRFGSGGPYQPVYARILTHEVGHYLNLRHVWGYSFDVGQYCTGDDLVADTPPTKGSVGCNDLNLSTCGYLDNVQNYMNYSYCYTMFTQGQVARMKAALNSSVAGRNNLWDPANLSLTGTDNLIPCVSTAISDHEQNYAGWLIFPNPTTGKLRVAYWHERKEVNLEIFNALGEKILQRINTDQVDLFGFPKGIYFISMHDGTIRCTQKIILE